MKAEPVEHNEKLIEPIMIDLDRRCSQNRMRQIDRQIDRVQHRRSKKPIPDHDMWCEEFRNRYNLLAVVQFECDFIYASIWTSDDGSQTLFIHIFYVSQPSISRSQTDRYRVEVIG